MADFECVKLNLGINAEPISQKASASDYSSETWSQILDFGSSL